MLKPQFIMIHHSAVSYNLNSDQFESNNRYHAQKWAFKSSLGFYLGYHYEISKMGKVRQARAVGETSAACYQKEMNSGKCIHICLDGNFEIEKPFPFEIYALRDLLRKLRKEYLIPKENIVFHKEYSATACPGKNMDLNFVRGISDYE